MTSEEAIDILKTHYHKNPRTSYSVKVKQATEMAIEVLQNRKIGRWKVEENPTAGRCLQKVYICDICGSAVGCGYFSRRSFCPACGSEMEDTDGTPLTLDRYEEWKKKKALEEDKRRQAQLDFCSSFREEDAKAAGCAPVCGAKMEVDMEIVIRLTEDDYKKVQDGRAPVTVMRNAIRKGTPLPKGHGRLGDLDLLVKSGACSESYARTFALVEADEEAEE